MHQDSIGTLAQNIRNTGDPSLAVQYVAFPLGTFVGTGSLALRGSCFHSGSGLPGIPGFGSQLAAFIVLSRSFDIVVALNND